MYICTHYNTYVCTLVCTQCILTYMYTHARTHTHTHTHTHMYTYAHRVTYVGRDEHCNAWLLSVVQCTACLYRMRWGCHKFFLGPEHHRHKALNTRQLSTHSNHHQLHKYVLIMMSTYVLLNVHTNTYFYNIWAPVQCS